MTLFVLPYILMGVAIFVVPRLVLPEEKIQRLTIVMVVGILVAGVVDLTASHFAPGSPFVLFYETGAALLMSAAGILAQYGLHDSHRVRWRYIVLSLALLVIAYLSLWDSARIGGIASVFALFTAVVASGVALVTAVWMGVSLPGWRKLAALVAGLVLPGLFLASSWLGAGQSPEEITERRGDVIVGALERYHAAEGGYPSDLVALVPDYLETLPDALTTQGTGWLYVSDEGTYTLGYWFWPVTYAMTLCRYSAEAPDWDCDGHGWAPFTPVPAPLPTTPGR